MNQIGTQAWQIPVLPRQALNCYLLGDVLVDAGVRTSGRKLLGALQGKAVSAHVVTHAHGDHQGASAHMCAALGVPLWCHEGERAALESGDVSATLSDPNGMLARLHQRFIAGPGHPVARVLGAGDTVAGFAVIETPGHTEGHVSLWRAEDGLLIAGDAVLGMNLFTTIPGLSLPPAMSSWDLNVARQSVLALAALKPRRVAFGHGPPATGDAFQRFAQKMT